MGTARARAQLLLPLLAVLTLLSATAPDHLLVGLAVAGLCVVAGRTLWAQPAAARVHAALERAAGCRATGVRAADPDRPGGVRPRAPGQA